MSRKEQKIEITIGFFVTLALVILVGGIMWGREVSLFSKRSWLTVRFEDVRGLEKGDPVVVRGIPQGEVSAISLSEQHAEVRFWIQKDVRLYEDFRVMIESRELMGGKQISIHPGSGQQPLNLHHVYYGGNQGDPLLIFNTIQHSLNKVDSVIDQINGFMGEKQLVYMIQNINQTADEVKALFAENRQTIHSTLDKFDETVQQFQKDSTTVRLAHLITQIDTTVTLMKQIALQLEDEEGTLGKFIYDKKLYDQLLETTIRMDSLITDVKAHPRRYIHVSLF